MTNRMSQQEKHCVQFRRKCIYLYKYKQSCIHAFPVDILSNIDYRVCLCVLSHPEEREKQGGRKRKHQKRLRNVTLSTSIHENHNLIDTFSIKPKITGKLTTKQ